MSLLKVDTTDDERLVYLISIGWYIFAAGVLGFLSVLCIFGFNSKIIIAGVLGGLGFSFGVLGSALGRNKLLLAAVIFCLVSIYFLPYFGRGLRGQVISYFFFTGLFIFSLMLLIIKFLFKKLNTSKQ